MASADDPDTGQQQQNNNVTHLPTTTGDDEDMDTSTDMSIEIPASQMIRHLMQQNASLTAELTELNKQIASQNAKIAELQELLSQALQTRKRTLSSSSSDDPEATGILSDVEREIQKDSAGSFETLKKPDNKKSKTDTSSVPQKPPSDTQKTQTKPSQPNPTGSKPTNPNFAAIPNNTLTSTATTTNNTPPMSIPNPNSTPKANKPVPIVIRDAAKWPKIARDLKGLKINCSPGRRIQLGVTVTPETIKDYRSMIQYLNQFKFEYHTHLLDEERCLNVILKKLQGIPIEEVKESLIEQGFTPLEIYHLKTKGDNSQRLIKVRLPQEQKAIFDIREVCHMTCTVEHQKATGDPSQCHNCNEFYHIATKCRADPVCLKCAEKHHFSKCPKPRDSPAKCCLCGGPHTANYGGCPKHPKNLKKNRSTANQKTTAPASTLAPIPKITTPLSATYSTTPSPVGTYANPVSVPEVQKSKPIQNSQHLIPKNSPTIDPQTQQIISLFTEMQQKFNTMIDGMAKTLVSVLMPQSPN